MSLTAFLKGGLTAYHVTARLVDLLTDAGFLPLSEDAAFSLVPGGKYFITRGDASLIAFALPTEAPSGFQIAAAHSDSPAFYITGEKRDGKYTRLSVERYGGPVSSTWYDRPLQLAGRVFVKSEGGVRSVLYESEERLVIPSVAPHQNREAESKVLSNPAVDLLPVFDRDHGRDILKERVARAVGAAASDILSADLYLVSAEAPMLWGEELVSAPRIDDLASVYALAQGLLAATPRRSIPVFAVFHGEEVGSMLFEGANSSFLDAVLARVCEALSLPYPQMLAQSFMLSVDNAHAIHPAHPELYHPIANATMGGGIVLKHTCSRRYTTDAFSDAMTRLLCDGCGVPVQEFRNRADLPGGGTLGTISATHVSVPAADIGLAQLAMHSAYETCSVRDVSYLTTLMAHFFSLSLVYGGGGARWE